MKDIEGRRKDMRQLSITPRLTVTIGRQTRLYLAYVTTAPAELDVPSTVTLQASTPSDVVGLAVHPITQDEGRGRAPARLVLVDAMTCAWQHATYHAHGHVLRPADPALVVFTRGRSCCGGCRRTPPRMRWPHAART
jgi:hypothetical protein